MKRGASLVVVLVAAAGCGPAGDCQYKELTGIFKSYEEGCHAVSIDTTPEKGLYVDLMPASSTVWTNALNDVLVAVPGYLYPGRRGSCRLTVSQDANSDERFHCDFRIGAVSHPEASSTIYELEIVDAYLAVGGLTGTFKGTATVHSFDQRISP